jgi:hypothetical protein
LVLEDPSTSRMRTQTSSTKVWANPLWHPRSFPSVESLHYAEPAYDEPPSDLAAGRGSSHVRVIALQEAEQPKRRPTWLGNVIERLCRSTSNDESEVASREYLSPETARAAQFFFERLGYLFPGEPYVYATKEGDLACEFRGVAAKATAIISPKFLVVHADTGDASAYLSFRDWRSAESQAAARIKDLRLA